jgi:uncharacterized protein YcbX
VSWLTVAPVKGLGLVFRDEVFLARDGVAENRRFLVVDGEGRRCSALDDGRLLQVRPEYDEAADRLALGFPGGSLAAGEVVLGEPVALDVYGRLVDGNAVEGPWSEELSSFLGQPVRLVKCRGAGVVDRSRGPVSLVSDASLEELGRRARADGAVDRRRFRMLVGVAGCEPYEEDGWCGREVAVGEAVVRLLEPVARCVITTRNPDTGERDFDTLRQLKEQRGLRDGKHLDFGVFGEVVREGRVRAGDRVEPLA